VEVDEDVHVVGLVPGHLLVEALEIRQVPGVDAADRRGVLDRAPRSQDADEVRAEAQRQPV
jgi:hypothetical protein